jgi:hypothetical protein
LVLSERLTPLQHLGETSHHLFESTDLRLVERRRDALFGEDAVERLATADAIGMLAGADDGLADDGPVVERRLDSGDGGKRRVELLALLGRHLILIVALAIFSWHAN